MYIKLKPISKTLIVEDDFADLIDVDVDGNMKFELRYRVNSGIAVKNDATNVKVTVSSRVLARPQIMPALDSGVIDTKQLIKNVLSMTTTAKNVMKKQETFNVVTKMSDVSSKLDNSMVSQTLSAQVGVKPKKLGKLTSKSVLAKTIKGSSDVLPLLTQPIVGEVSLAPSASMSLNNPTSLMHEMIINQGIDPSAMLSMAPRASSASSTLLGTHGKHMTSEITTSPMNKLLNYHLFSGAARPAATTDDVDDGAYVQVITSEYDENVEVLVGVVIEPRMLRVDGKDNMTFNVKFELVNVVSMVPIDSITKVLDVAKHLSVYNMPKHAPFVTASTVPGTYLSTLNLKVDEPCVQCINVYRKSIRCSTQDNDVYTLVGTYKMKSSDGTMTVNVDSPKGVASIYRVVPVGQNNALGFEYSNVVVGNDRSLKIKSACVNTKIDIQGVSVDVLNIPQNVVAVEVLARDLTQFERTYTNVGSKVFSTAKKDKTLDYVTIIDTDVVHDHVYEYAAKLIYLSGLTEIVGHNTIEFIRPQPERFSTVITDFNIDATGDLDVQFNVQTKMNDSLSDVVLSVLRQQDLYELFKGDVEREREFLNGLIAHSIYRVDLTTGVRENFGIISTSNFSDRELRKKSSVSNLKIGHRYAYEVNVLMRFPETMFETLRKVVVDQETKKTYVYNPAKFRNPMALEHGILTSFRGTMQRYARDEMTLGLTGVTVTVNASFVNADAQIVDVKAARFSRAYNKIAWRVIGDLTQIDHFVLLKDSNGVRSTVGKVHSNFANENCQFIHVLSDNDRGQLTYKIVPVYNDYRVGSEVTTNAIIV